MSNRHGDQLEGAPISPIWDNLSIKIKNDINELKSIK